MWTWRIGMVKQATGISGWFEAADLYKVPWYGTIHHTTVRKWASNSLPDLCMVKMYVGAYLSSWPQTSTSIMKNNKESKSCWFEKEQKIFLFPWPSWATATIATTATKRLQKGHKRLHFRHLSTNLNIICNSSVDLFRF